MAVGQYGSVYTSPDGVTWTQTALLQWETYYSSVAYGNGTFVMAGFAHPAGIEMMSPAICTSPDGITWTAARVPLPYGTLVSVNYCNGMFVAVGSAYARPNTGLYIPLILTSSDGVTWSQANTPACLETLYAVTYGGGKYVAVGDGPVLTSRDGVNWNKAYSPPPGTYFSGIAYGDGYFMAAAGGGLRLFRRHFVESRACAGRDGWSPKHYLCRRAIRDRGMAWADYVLSKWELDREDCGRQLDHIRIRRLWKGDLRGGGKIKQQRGQGGGRGHVSRRGHLDRPGFFGNQPRSLKHCLRQWGLRGGRRLQYLPDGNAGHRDLVPTAITWQGISTPEGVRLMSVIYENSAFLALGYDNSLYDSGLVALTSTDGVDWTRLNISFTHAAPYSVAYGKGIFVAVGGETSESFAIITSPDGVNWTGRTAPGPETYLLAVAYGNGAFVAGGTGRFTHLNRRSLMDYCDPARQTHRSTLRRLTATGPSS